MNCLCGGLTVGLAPSGLDVAALKAEIVALSKVDALVVARRSAVVAELARRDGDVAEQLRKGGNMSSREARKAGRTAAGLERLPKTREALERGEIGVGQAEALASRMDKPEQARNVRDNEDALLEKAKNQDVDEFARTMRQEDIAGSPDHGNTHAQRQRQSRKASMWIDDDTGMHLLFAEFDPVTGARISTQLAAMVDQLWRAEHLPGATRRNKRAVAQRRADALEALICRNTPKKNADASTKTGTTEARSRSDARCSGGGTKAGTSTSNGNGDNDGNGNGNDNDNDNRTGDRNGTGDGGATSTSEEHAAPVDAPAGQPSFNFGPTDAADAEQADVAAPQDAATQDDPGLAPVVPAPNPTQLMVIANLDALRSLLAGGSLPDRTPLSAEAVAKLACDAELLPAIFDTTGQPLWLGRSQRLATPAQRAAVTARDRGCIGCGAAAEWCQVHHITWWSRDGKTDLDNLCLLCSKHHHLVHDHHLRIVTTPDGPKIHTGPTRTTGQPQRHPTHQRGSPAAA